MQDIVYKLVMGLTPDDVRVVVKAGHADEIRRLIEALGWLAFRWWSTPGDKDAETLKEVQARLGKLQVIVQRQH